MRTASRHHGKRHFTLIGGVWGGRPVCLVSTVAMEYSHVQGCSGHRGACRINAFVGPQSSEYEIRSLREIGLATIVVVAEEAKKDAEEV